MSTSESKTILTVQGRDRDNFIHITIPQSIAVAFDIKRGTKMQWVVDEGKLVCKKV